MITVSFYGLSSVLCFSLPLAVILIFRLYRHASLIALGLYYVLTIVHCLTAESLPPVPDFNNPWDVAYSYVEIPLILSSLFFFCHAKQRQRLMKNVITGFIGWEVAVSLYFRFSPEAAAYVTAPGLVVLLAYSTFLFLRQAKFSFLHGKNIGRVLMLGAILFSHACYLFVFYARFVEGQSDVAGIYYIYFASSAIASLMMSVGLYMMRHRIRELQELKVVRRELQLIFGNGVSG